MMRWLTIALLLATTATDAGGQVLSDLTPEQVREALINEKAEACYPLAVRDKSLGFSLGVVGVPIGCFTTPYSRVVGIAATARKKYKTATEADITAEVIAPGELHIHAFASATNGPGMANVETVVILPTKIKDRSLAIQPIRTVDTSADYKNLMGASFEGRSITAVFPLSVLTESHEVHMVFDKMVRSPSSCTDCSAPFKLKKVK